MNQETHEGRRAEMDNIHSGPSDLADSLITTVTTTLRSWLLNGGPSGLNFEAKSQNRRPDPTCLVHRTGSGSDRILDSTWMAASPSLLLGVLYQFLCQSCRSARAGFTSQESYDRRSNPNFAAPSLRCNLWHDVHVGEHRKITSL